MTTTTTTISSFNLTKAMAKALLLSCAKKGIRYYLNGVNFKSTGNSTIAASSTDGHRALTVGIEENEKLFNTYSVIFPREQLESIVKSKLKYDNVLVSILKSVTSEAPDKIAQPIVKTTYSFKVKSDNGEVSFPAIDGVFPDIARALPDLTETRQAKSGFNVEYLIDARKQKDLLTKTESKVYQGTLVGFVQNKENYETELLNYLRSSLIVELKGNEIIHINELSQFVTLEQIERVINDFYCSSSVAFCSHNGKLFKQAFLDNKITPVLIGEYIGIFMPLRT